VAHLCAAFAKVGATAVSLIFISCSSLISIRPTRRNHNADIEPALPNVYLFHSHAERTRLLLIASPRLGPATTAADNNSWWIWWRAAGGARKCRWPAPQWRFKRVGTGSAWHGAAKQHGMTSSVPIFAKAQRWATRMQPLRP